MRRPNWLGGFLLAIAVAITACASIMGVEEARLDDAATAPEAGTSTSSSASSSSASSSGQPAADAAPPCAGRDCPCERASDCIDPVFKACEKGLCRECSLSPDDCPADQYCQASTLQCVPGCKGDAACTTGLERKCDPVLHRCAECLAPADCGAGTGKTCSSGACVATGCDANPGKCTANELCCNDACVKKLTDPNNCNACGNVCPGGANGLCCNGTCANVATDARNCGSCGRVCNTTQAATTTCVNRACDWTCRPGFTHCQGASNTGCDTNINTATVCGACTTNCTTQVRNATGARCTSGASGLRCDYNSCNSGFADTDGNRANGCDVPCGATGGACCPGGGSAACGLATDRCVAGVCQPCVNNGGRCDVGEECCGGTCDDPPGKCR